MTIRAAEVPFMRGGQVVTCDYVDEEGKVCGATATRVNANGARCHAHGYPTEAPEVD